MPVAATAIAAATASTLVVRILVASQTGTATRLGDNLASGLRACPGLQVVLQPITPELVSLSAILAPAEETLLTPEVLVFVLSTYGSGAPPDDAAPLYQWIVDPRRLREDFRSNLTSVAVFGLGDSQYPQFALPAKTVAARLAEMGFPAIAEAAWGDAANGSTDDAFDSWVSTALLPGLEKAQDASAPAGRFSDAFAKAKATCDDAVLEYGTTATAISSAAVSAPPFPICAPLLAPTAAALVLLPVANVQTLYAGDGSDGTQGDELRSGGSGGKTVAITFDVTELPNVLFQAGDHLAVQPPNRASDVKAAMNAFFPAGGARDGDTTTISLLRVAETPQQSSTPLVNVGSAAAAALDRRRRSVLPLTDVPARDVFTWYVDLAARPTAAVLRSLDITDNHDGDDGNRLGNATIPPPRRSIADLLRRIADQAGSDTPQDVEARLKRFLLAAPRLKARFFSIASDPSYAPGALSITVRHVPGGLCSEMLCGDGAAAVRWPAYVRSSGFHLPRSEADRPVVMIGAGTGIAPLVGLLQRRWAWTVDAAAPPHTNGGLGPATAVLGCRRRPVDLFHGPFFESSLARRALTDLFVAQSRLAGPNSNNAASPTAKYVQDVPELVLRSVATLRAGGRVFVCGSRAMAIGVKRAIILAEGREAGLQLLREAKAAGRYLEDAW